MAKLDYESHRPRGRRTPGAAGEPTGTRFSRYGGHVARIRPEVSEEEAAKHWHAPVILIGCAFAMYIALGLYWGGVQEAAIWGLVAVASGVIETVLLVASAFLVAALFNIGFGEFWFATLRLAAAALFSNAVGAIIPFLCLDSIVALIVFVGLAMKLLDLEFFEAALLTMVYVVVTLVVVVFVYMLFGDVF